VQCNNEKTLLSNEVNAKAKEVNDLKKKNSDLAGVVQSSRCKVRESRRREKLAEDETLKLERELEVMKSTFDEALMKAVDEVAMKEKVGTSRPCVEQCNVFLESCFFLKNSTMTAAKSIFARRGRHRLFGCRTTTRCRQRGHATCPSSSTGDMKGLIHPRTLSMSKSDSIVVWGNDGCHFSISICSDTLCAVHHILGPSC
jgi:hypothetical protein